MAWIFELESALREFAFPLRLQLLLVNLLGRSGCLKSGIVNTGAVLNTLPFTCRDSLSAFIKFQVPNWPTMICLSYPLGSDEDAISQLSLYSKAPPSR